MLKEFHDVRQRPEEGLRRWFRDDTFDLIVWYSDDAVSGFQLCYDTDENERAITWYATGSYVHARVDDGERPGGHKSSPVLVSDGVFDATRVAARFLDAAKEMDADVAELVYNRLMAYAG